MHPRLLTWWSDIHGRSFEWPYLLFYIFIDHISGKMHESVVKGFIDLLFLHRGLAGIVMADKSGFGHSVISMNPDESGSHVMGGTAGRATLDFHCLNQFCSRIDGDFEFGLAEYPGKGCNDLIFI